MMRFLIPKLIAGAYALIFVQHGSQALEYNRLYLLTGTISSEVPSLMKRKTDMLPGTSISGASGRIGWDIPDRQPPSGPGAKVQAKAKVRVATIEPVEEPSMMRRTLEILSRMEPAIETSLRFRKLENASSSSSQDSTEALMLVSPSARFLTQGRKWSLDSQYRYSGGRYWGENNDSTFEHRLKSKYTLNIMTRSTLTADFHYRDASNQQHSGDRDSGGMVDMNSTGLNIAFNRGTPKDRLRFATRLETQKVGYSGDTDMNRYAHSRVSINGTSTYQFRYWIAFFLELDHQDYDYSDRLLDSEQSTSMMGARINYRNRIIGTAKIGRENYQFSDSGDSDSLGIWNFNLAWKPKRNTQLEIRTSRDFIESYTIRQNVRADEETIEKRSSLGWKQAWSSKLRSELTFSKSDHSFTNVRYDKETWKAGIYYSLNPKISVSFTAEVYDRAINKVFNTQWTTLFFKANMKL